LLSPSVGPADHDYYPPACAETAVSTYPERAKTVNARRSGTASVVVLSDDFGGPWIQVDGDAQVTPRRWSPIATGGFPARLG
jgi:hypothetical protein